MKTTMTTRWGLGLVLVAAMGCGDAVSSSGNASVDGGPTGGGAEGCNNTCAAQARANCSAFQMGSCVSECQRLVGSAPTCRTQIDALFRCGESAPFTCDSDNEPTTMSCSGEALAVFQCSAPDAGP